MNNINATSHGALYAGLEAYRNGSESVTNGSRELASRNAGANSADTNNQGSGARTIDVNRAAVELVSGSLQAKASAEVISSADEMLGTIIDTFA